MKTTYFLPLLLLIISCQSKIPSVEYPITEKKEVIDTYFGVEVVDNYDGWRTIEVKKLPNGLRSKTR